MAGKVDIEELKSFADKLNRINSQQRDEFFNECAKELAARLLRKVVKRTPAGVKPRYADEKTLDRYWAGYAGGNLRRGWTGGREINPSAYANSLSIIKSGGIYSVEIINPTEYASYVENGHRQTKGRYVPQIGKRLKNSFVDGKEMLKISVEELDSIAPGVLMQRLNKKLREVFG